MGGPDSSTLPVVQANGVRTLFFAQPRRAMQEQVWHVLGRLEVLLPPPTPNAKRLGRR